jgi:hypothetical protein
MDRVAGQGIVSGLWTARDANVAVAARTEPDGELAILVLRGLDRMNAEAKNAKPDPMTRLEASRTLGIVAISPDGSTVAVAGAEGKFWLFDAGQERAPRESPPTEHGNVTAFAFSDNDRIHVAFELGAVQSYSTTSERIVPIGETFVSLPGLPVALAQVKREGRPAFVAGLDDGRVVAIETAMSDRDAPPVESEIHLPWAARRIIPFASIPAGFWPGGLPSGSGMSIAVLGQRGEFDVVGLALPGTTPPTFRPMRLMDRALGYGPNNAYAAGVAAQSRRVAVCRESTVEIRLLTYRLQRDAAALDDRPQAEPQSLAAQ